MRKRICTLLYLGLVLAASPPLGHAQEAPTITQAEYFFDHDPGEGLGTALIAPDGPFNSAEESVDTDITLPADIEPGYHQLFVRMKSNLGVWGMARRVPFLVTAELTVTNAEYFFDTDPGEGHGHLLAVTGVPVDSRLAFLDGTTIETSALAPGMHRVFVRAQDSMGRWGPARSMMFEVQAQPVLAAAEYCIVSTPGLPPADAVWQPLHATDGDFNQSSEALSSKEIDTLSLASGHYTVWVRARDNTDRVTAPGDMASAPLIVANAPPRLASRSDLLLGAGANLDTAIAAINDGEGVQTLVFSLAPGAPAGAAIDAATGRLTWTVPPGSTPTTNVLRVRVSDQTSPGSMDEIQVTVFGEDPAQPSLLEVESAGAMTASQEVGLRFNRPVDETTAEDPSHYEVAGQQPLSVERRADGRTLALRMPSLVPPFFTGTVNGVKDALGRLPAVPLAFSGEATPLTGAVLGAEGDPLEAGSDLASAPDRLAMTAGGSSFYDIADHGRFAHERLDGNFDLRVQVSRLAPVTFATSGGLMVREALSAGAVGAGLYLRTGEVGPEVLAVLRTASNGLVQIGARAPAQAPPPDVWMRIRRSGERLEFYQGTNGTAWTLILSTNRPLAQNLYVGLATCSQDNALNQVTTAEYRSYGFFSPGLVTHPQSQSVAAGAANVTFAVNARGLAPLTYAWYFNGNLLAGQHGPTLVLPSASLSQVGDYAVVVANAMGSVTSRVATLVVDGFGNGGFEGDLMPRPGGDNHVGLSDWVMAGRLMARLESVRTQNEFQRADCAPRSSRGDGQLNLMDWVQAGRYVVGLDPLTGAEGPTTQGGPGARPSPPPPPPEPPRAVWLADTLARPGGLSQVSIRLLGDGAENAVGFSLQFDPTRLRFQKVELAPGREGMFLQVNTQAAAQGRVGLAMALSPGQTLAAGDLELVQVTFAVGAEPGDAVVGFADEPLRREVVDAQAEGLSSGWAGATVQVGEPTGRAAWRLNRGVGMELSFLGEPGVEHAVETSEDLIHWTPVSRIRTASGVIQWTDPDPSDRPARFYRVRRNP